MFSGGNSIKVFGLLVFVAHLVFQSTPAEAISLEFVPASQSAVIGSQVTVDVIVSNPDGTLVGAYDFFVNYEPNALTLNDVVFGSALGGPLDSLQDDTESPAGEVNVSELSLLTDLTPLQNGTDDVLLFSMTFDTDMLGTSSLTFSENIAGIDGGFLGDENGQAIMLDSVGTGSINVVPIPGAIWLMGSGLFALYGFTKRQQNAG
jgi:hypothetical protein